MVNTPYKELSNSPTEFRPFMQFLIFLAVLLVALIIGNLIGAGIIGALYGLKTFTAITTLNTAAPNFLNALWILQLAGTTLPILATPIFFAYVVAQNPAEYIRSNFTFPWLLLVLIFAMMFISAPLIELLSNINQKMNLPPFLKWMRDSEDSAQKLTDVMLQMNTVWSMIFNLIFVGLLTAIVEEFMFRGCLQTIFEKWTKNTHAAIWITAILFSAFHMEFFGFLPRLLLGVMFGYFVAWSGSIWASVWAHFINNGTDVVLTYLSQHKKIGIKPDDQHVFNSKIYILSFIIILFLFWIYRQIALNKKLVQL